MTAQLQVPRLAAGTWTVADSRTRVTFTATSLGRPVHGSVACSRGEMDVDDSGGPHRIRAELDLDTLDTGIAKRDSDLRKARLLDIDRQPTMSWSADRFSRHDDGSWTAEGRLSVRGTSAPLAVTGTPEAVDGECIRVRATGSIDRTAVGIRAPRFLIGRVVGVEVDAWLTPPG